MFKRAFSFVSSLRLTVACLVMAMVLVFAGTLAQVQLGLWEAQKLYFQSAFVYWTPGGTDWKIPVWPGGYLLGWVLLVNLLAAHAVRFKFTRKKTGIFLIHAGLILLLLGQFFTELFQVESSLRLEEGESKNYSEATRLYELAVIDVTDPTTDAVVAIPDAKLSNKGEVTHPALPFKIRVKDYFPNTDPELVAPMVNADAPRATHGYGQRLTFKDIPVSRKMDSVNIPAAHLEITGADGGPSTWMVSAWTAVPDFLSIILRQPGWQSMLGDLPSRPQELTANGRTYQLVLRPTRYYKFVKGSPIPYHVELLDFRHDRYLGTGIAKNFSSDVRIKRFSETGEVVEDREVLIKMNQPLRYAGETYYQGSFDPRNDRVTILHVVRNPAWLTPYIACTLVGLGLTVQFLMHLVGFVKKRPGQRTRSDSGTPEPPSAAGRKSKDTPKAAQARSEPAVVALRRATGEGAV